MSLLLASGGGGPVTHSTSGALTGPGAAVAGSAARVRLHGTSGALAGSGALIVGSADRVGAVVIHGTTGVLVAAGSIIVGSATLAALSRGGGGASARRQRGRGWAREREILEQSLLQIDEAQIQSIARAMADSERPQAQRIARKLIDYSGEVAQIESLRRELAKLEAAQQERTEANLARQQYDADMQAAAVELRAVLRDDDDAIAALQAAEEMDIRHVLGILGLTIH